jgi:hypothetical protein
VVRALEGVFDRKLAQLPDRGILIVATDLQGNFGDYEELKRIHQSELSRGEAAILALTGDLVHGPSPDMADAWPDYLGTQYADRSAELILDFERYTRTAPAFSLLGNHEHAHIGGPVVAKFYDDEAAVLDLALGAEKERIHDFFRSFPLLARSRSGVVLTHGAPGATEPDEAAFEFLAYEGHRDVPIFEMHRHGTVGALLWSRAARAESARALLDTLLGQERAGGFVAFGHDVVREGWATDGDEQICVSTSYALEDARKVYLRLDLSRVPKKATDLRFGVEILPLRRSSYT